MRSKRKDVLFELALSLAVALALFAAGRFFEHKEDNALRPVHTESYRDDGFQDYTDYEKSVYAEEDRERVLAALEASDDFQKVETLYTVRQLQGYFSDFSGWAALMDWYENYDLSPGIVDVSDYYCILEAEKDDYSIYFFDVQTLTEHYIHNNT